MGLAHAAAGAQLIVTCGPFAPKAGTATAGVRLPATGKFVSLTRDPSGEVRIHDPFILESDPPSHSDTGFVMVGANGKVLPAPDYDHNTTLDQGEKTPWSEEATYHVWDLDNHGAPVTSRTETFTFSRRLGRRTQIGAIVDVPPAKGAFIAYCD